MLKFAFREFEGVPDGYLYVFPDGYKSRNLHRSSWYEDINKHYRDNGIPQPANWKELAEHQWCLGAPPGWCKHETGEPHQGYFNTRMTMEDYLHGSIALAAIALHKDPLVDKETAERRAKICAACPANLNVPGCAPCVGIANYILAVKGSQSTSADSFLLTCAHCKCSNEASVWVKTEILSQHTEATALAGMRAMPECWKVNEIDNYGK